VLFPYVSILLKVGLEFHPLKKEVDEVTQDTNDDRYWNFGCWWNDYYAL
jgi:hypothetical protein